MCGGMQPAIASCLFLGVEHELMLCNMLVFCVVDMWAQNMVVAAIACYAVERFMVVLRAQRGDENMAGTTLLDPRFLF
jgi:type IV secretory pathway VirB3-like protein|tara:strand:- start:155 stop:388 length:234 start_codon:yes stop_codon:yes gene_type:complete